MRWLFVLGLSILLTRPSAAAPVITNQPVDQTIFFGDPGTFRVGASGTAPLRYQWYRNGAAINSATTNTYTQASVSSNDNGAGYSVIVTNTSGAVTSSVALLIVDFGVAGLLQTNHLLAFADNFKYNQTGTNIGSTWMTSGYNDTQPGWLTGPGVFDAKWSGTNYIPRNAIGGQPVGTQLNMKPLGTNAACFWFRTHFTFHPWQAREVADARLIAPTLLDDGAIFYLNGREGYRLGAANSGWNAWASRTISDAAGETFDLPITNLVDGDNVVAVELHQVNSGSSDLTFGLDLGTAIYPRLRDTNAPTLVELIPAPGLVVALTQIEVHFSEAVKGVQAGDLLINNVPATNATQYAPDVYVFSFHQPPNGPVQVVWKSAEAIIDLSANSNRFNGGSYSYTLNPTGMASNVRINEFMAGNQHSIVDENGIHSDWIELFNSGDTAIDLGHWYLTDNATKLTKWQFPSGVTLLSKDYMIVWASGNNRTNPAAPLHTNFKLDKDPGNFLGLVYTNGISIVSSFANYPQQYDDVSYGRDRLDPSIIGYFTNATPDEANATAGANFAPEVTFSRVSGTFRAPFTLTLSTTSSNTPIRYFLVTNTTSAALTNVPNTASLVYTGPISISNSIQVRARAFPAQTNFFPGPPASQTFIQISAGAAAFNAPNPIVLFHNFGGGTPPATADQAGVMMVFDTSLGRASLTNPPDLVTRIGFNIRGRSTQNNPQSSYAVETWDEFNESKKIELLGLPAESDWIFYAPNNFDKPFIHNPFTHELSRRIGRYSSRVRMLEVFDSFGTGAVGYISPTLGSYNGVYVLEEKIKADPSRVDIPKLGPEETSQPTITGGYILKIDSPNAGERTLFAANQSMVYVEPKMSDYAAYPGRATQESYINDYFNSFYSALFSADWTDPATGYAAWIDPDSWIDHHILEVLTRNADALRLSSYFFKDRGNRIEMGPLWDFDRSMGTSAGNDWRAWNPRSWMGSNPLGSSSSADYGTDYFNPGSVFPNPWYSQLFYDPDFWQRWIDRWQSLRLGAFSTNSIFGIIDMFVSQVSEAQPRQTARWAAFGASDTTPRYGLVSAPAGWPDTSYIHFFPGTYQGEIDFMKQWLNDRLNFIDTNFLAKPVFSSSGGPINLGFSFDIAAPGAEPDTMTYYTLDGTDPRTPGGGISPSALFGIPPITVTLDHNARVMARNYNLYHQNLAGFRNPPLSSSWSGPTAATFVINTPGLAITEIMYHPAAPGSGPYTAGDFEFIELKNVGVQTLNLIGFQFTNGIRFTFTATTAITTLAPGQYLVLVKDQAAFASRYPTVANVAGQYTGSLNNGGEHLYLEGALKEPLLDFSFNDAWYPTTDGGGFSLVIRNESASFYTWTNPASWRVSAAINGSPGRVDPPPANIPAILINEALTHTDPPQVDTIELYNPTASPVPVTGWFLSDDHAQPLKYRIPRNTMPSGGYLLFNETQFNNNGTNSFALGSLGDDIYLFSGDGTNITGYRHGFAFGAQHNGVTFGRFTTSDDLEHFVAQKSSTLGFANTGPKVGPVVINEIMYSPPALGLDTDTLDEYVELRNFSGQTVPLYDPLHTTNRWRLDGAVQFVFPEGVTMAPWSCLLVVSFDPVADPVSLNRFTNHYNLDANVHLFGPWQGHLENQGERVGIYEPDNPQVSPDPNAGFVPYVLVEEVHYSPVAPWPAGADATGNSLQRIAALSFADEPANWSANVPNPGRVNQSSLLVDTDGDGLPDEWEIANGLDPFDPTANNGAASDPDGDGLTNWQEYLGGTSPTNRLDFLSFQSATVSNPYCVLEFTPRAGRTYAIEKLEALTAINTWTTLVDNITGTNLFTVYDPLSPTAHFYRIKARLSP